MALSAESILTDVIGQSTDLIVTATPVVIGAPGVGQLLIGAQPLRQAFLVCAADVGTWFAVAPMQQVLTGAVSRVVQPAPVLIHSAAFPLLVGMPWFIVAAAVDTVTVFQVLRRV